MPSIIVQMEPRAAAAFASPNVADPVSVALDHAGLAMAAQHPGTFDSELGSYFVVRGAPHANAESVAARLRDLDGVTAAYVAPEPFAP